MTRERGGILVVDDLPEQRMTIEVALSDLGQPIVSASSGLQALKYLLEHDVAVILLDVNMPDMDGFETAALIRQRPRNANTPIIFLTADHDTMQASRGYALGAVDYITCPFLPDILRTKVGVFVALDQARERIREEGDRRLVLQREQVARAAAEEKNRQLRVLGEAGMILAGSLEGEPFETTLLNLLIPSLAAEASLRFAERSDGDTTIWVRGTNGDGTQAGEPASDGSPALASLCQTALASRTIAAADTDVMDRPRQIALPLVLYDRTVGTLAVARDGGEPGYTSDERELLRLIAERAAMALDNRRLYRELQERDRRKDEFLAMLSHELRNPLGAITAAAHVLHLLRLPDDKAMRASDVISRQSAYLSRLIDDLLEVSRVTSGRITLRRTVLDMRELADATVEALRSSGRLDGRVVTVAGRPVCVEADATRMEQVVTNLVINAAKYTDPGGQITVEIDCDADLAYLRVSDDGIGIAPDLLENMFDLFVQGDQSLDRGQGGLGIGLTLVRRLVDLQGGSVRAHSEGANRGSTFQIQLPRVGNVAPVQSSETGSARSRKRLRVLLVDDNEDARIMLRLFFETRDHDVIEASTGPEAVEVAQRERPNLALVDLGLPGFDGLEVARRLRQDERTRDIALVAITGYGQPEDRRRSAEAGFEAHLVKPVSVERLDQALTIAADRMSGTRRLTVRTAAT